MKIRIAFKKEDVVARGDDFVELKLETHQSPMLPAWVMLMPEDDKPAQKGRYITVTHGKKLGMGSIWK